MKKPRFKSKIPDKAPPRFENQSEQITYLLSEYKTPITATLIAGLILVVSGRIGIPEIPPEWSVALTGFVAGAIPAAIVGKKVIVEPFIDKPTVKVEELNLEDKTVETHEIPEPLWRDRQQGDRSPWQPDHGNMDYVVTNLDFMEDIGKLSVTGVNRELVDPVDIIVRDQRIEEIHQDLLEEAAEYRRYKARERSRRLDRDDELVSNLIAAIEHGLEFEPGTMEAVQNDDLDKFKDEKVDKSESNRTDTDDPEMQTLNQMLGYEQDALSGSGADTAATDGGADQ